MDDDEVLVPSTSWHSYPKIYALGHAATSEILHNDVIVQEKVDGSQFSFGVFDGELKTRSKGREFHHSAADNIFKGATETAVRLFTAGLLKEGWTYRAEALQKPHHNVLSYSRVPVGNIILFDINTGYEQYLPLEQLSEIAASLGLECVPILMEGHLTQKAFEAIMTTTAFLGGPALEGVVIKSVVPYYGRDGKAVMAKFVREDFKEEHAKTWGEGSRAHGSVVDRVIARYRTPVRWQKALQHLRDDGILTASPQDIGALISEIKRDLLEECGEEIAKQIFSDFEGDVLRGITRGAPEWYKERLASKAFEDQEEEF